MLLTLVDAIFLCAFYGLISAAFAPFVHPRILVGIILENEGGGSAKAAPLARKMIDKYLLDLYPDGYMGEKEPVQMKFGLGGTVMVQ